MILMRGLYGVPFHPPAAAAAIGDTSLAVTALPGAIAGSVVGRKVQDITGYTLEWGGEYESSKEAQEALIPGVVPTVVIMAFIAIALFNAYRPPLIIALVIPFVMIGIAVGLIVTGQPFGFMALLGAMSLVGMMIKNAIVLLDYTRRVQRRGKDIL
ncbi:hypothetical protein LCGC14_1648690, partial [marine sediment metagenome]